MNQDIVSCMIKGTDSDSTQLPRKQKCVSDTWNRRGCVNQPSEQRKTAFLKQETWPTRSMLAWRLPFLILTFILELWIWPWYRQLCSLRYTSKTDNGDQNNTVILLLSFFFFKATFTYAEGLPPLPHTPLITGWFTAHRTSLLICPWFSRPHCSPLLLQSINIYEQQKKELHWFTSSDA